MSSGVYSVSAVRIRSYGGVSAGSPDDEDSDSDSVCPAILVG